jgi:hypothetical protein
MPSAIEAFGRARATARKRGIEAARVAWFELGGWFDMIRAHPDRCRADTHWAIVSEFPEGPWLDGTRARPITSI